MGEDVYHTLVNSFFFPGYQRYEDFLCFLKFFSRSVNSV